MGKVAGFDLGTTYSAVAVIGATGKPEILINRDGERITPSVVLFDEDTVLVGSMAKRSAANAPLDVAQFVKRQMGDPDWSFEPSVGGSYTAEEISALILKRLKEDAEIFLGGEKLTDAVITVPAFFDDARRRATKDAGKIAGLNVLRVLNEPTAAALAFGVDLGGSGTVMVYDLGGGTFDVTIMKITGSTFDVLGTDGLHELGGFEWDNRLMLWLNDEFQRAGGADLTETFESEAELREKAEVAKRTLSQAPSARVVLSHGGSHKTLTVTREVFEDITSDLLNQSRDMVISLVESLLLEPSTIDHVLLVGGSTRMPMVSTMLEEIFSRRPLRAGNPDELVALGAAIQAEIENDINDVNAAGSPIVLDVTSQALGTIALNSEHVRVNSIIIPKNTKIPAKCSEIFSTVNDNQTEIQIEITQGDDEDPDYVKFVTQDGGQRFSIPPYPAGAPIQITFHYDIDQTIQVGVTDLTAQLVIGTFEIDNVANLSDEDIAEAVIKNRNLEVN